MHGQNQIDPPGFDGRVGHVLDRARLQASSCECYEVVKNEYDRLLG